MQTTLQDLSKPFGNPSRYSPAPSAPPYDDNPLNASNATEASAPPITEEELEQLQNKVNDLNLALMTSELEYINSQLKRIQNEINQMDTTKCDKQCREANESIESNTVDIFLKNNINNIFNK
jgi:Zn-dependent oligopeptidase